MTKKKWQKDREDDILFLLKKVKRNADSILVILKILAAMEENTNASPKDKVH